MSLTTFDELKSAVANWSARDNLTTYIPDFITLAEKRMNRDIRVSGLETSLSDTIASGVIPVPSDYLEMKLLYINQNPVVRIEPIALNKLYAKYPDRTSNNTPRFFARNGSNFEFGPYPDTTYSVMGVYYQKPTALSSSNATNFYITNLPDALLYASLIELSYFVKDDSEAKRYNSLYRRALDDIKREDVNQEFSGSELRSWPG